MKQITKYTYEVEPDEDVILIFTAIQVGETYVAVSLDGKTLKPNPASPPTFKFPVLKPKGETHFGKIECTFLGDTPDTAQFDSRVQGSFGGDFEGPTVKKTDAVHDPNINFDVV